MCVGGMFTALAFVVTMVIHIKVVFLTFDFKDAVMLIGAMICGPVYAILMPVVIAFLELFTISETGIYGLVMNILSSIAFALPASLIYHYKKSLKSALLGIFTAVFTVTAVMLIANLIITPYYYHMDVAGVAKMIPTLLLPFNLTKSLLNAGIVMLLYKPVIGALRKARLIEKRVQSSANIKGERSSTLIMLLLSILLITFSLVVFFVILGGKISIGI